MKLEQYGHFAEIASAVAAVGGFIAIFWQLHDATRALSFNSVTQYAELTGACKTNPKVEHAAAVQIQVWDELCEARILSHEIVVNDFLRATGSANASQVNLDAARLLSIQLEDGLVRELEAQAIAFQTM